MTSIPLARVATLVLACALTTRASAQPAGFLHWPPELLSRAPALSDGIEREFGQRPKSIEFVERTALQVVIWNPEFWHTDLDSKELPKGSLELVRQMGLNVAEYVWRTFARDAGIDILTVTFVRVRRVDYATVLYHEVPAQEVSFGVGRKQFEIGHPEMGLISITQR